MVWEPIFTVHTRPANGWSFIHPHCWLCRQGVGRSYSFANVANIVRIMGGSNKHANVPLAMKTEAWWYVGAGSWLSCASGGSCRSGCDDGHQICIQTRSFALWISEIKSAVHVYKYHSVAVSDGEFNVYCFNAIGLPPFLTFLAVEFTYSDSD